MESRPSLPADRCIHEIVEDQVRLAAGFDVPEFLRSGWTYRELDGGRTDCGCWRSRGAARSRSWPLARTMEHMVVVPESRAGGGLSSAGSGLPAGASRLMLEDAEPGSRTKNRRAPKAPRKTGAEPICATVLPRENGDVCFGPGVRPDNLVYDLRLGSISKPVGSR